MRDRDQQQVIGAEWREPESQGQSTKAWLDWTMLVLVATFAAASLTWTLWTLWHLAVSYS